MHRHFPYITAGTAFLTVLGLWVSLFAVVEIRDVDLRTAVFLLIIAALCVAAWFLAGRYESMEHHARGIAKEQQDFAKLVTHELRLPLSQSRWAVDIAYEDSGIGDEARKALADSRIALASATTLLSDLTLISRLDRGVQPIDVREHVPLQDVFREVMRRFDGPEFADTRFDVGPVPPVELIADKRMLVDGISAFVSASSELGRAAGYVALDVSVFENRGVCDIRISDGGDGPSDAIFSLLADPHKRFSSTDETLGRVGIGMYAAKRGLRATKCTVAVERAPGETSYIIRIPLHVTAAQREKGRH